MANPAHTSSTTRRRTDEDLSAFESLIYIRLSSPYNETGRHMYESSLDMERLAAIIVPSEPLSSTELEGW